ncbi:energy transducer TonB [Methylocystis sp. IM3]|uniref:energy transducer TonB n=1 Tax=unclassified Methylocystis TaxID=2625913 RepID=UPI0030F8E6D2
MMFLHFDPAGRPPLRPDRIFPVATALVVAAHVFVFAVFMQAARPNLIPLGSIGTGLAPEGDFLEVEAISEQDLPPDAPEPEDARVKADENAAPPPVVAVPDAPRLPARKDADRTTEKPTPKSEKKSKERRNVAYGNERREAQARRRYGAPGGGGSAGAGASQATCLAYVAAALRRHTPGSTRLGPGSAFVTFRIAAGGGIAVVSASGTTPGHAALARRIVSAARGPGICGAAFVSQSIYFD